MGKELEIAKQIITEEIEKQGIEIVKIILFGSRARGNFSHDSDWDFYVIVNQETDFIKKRKLNAQIRKRLAEEKIPNDIIIQSQSIVEKRKNDVGCLTYYALKEGKVI